MRRALPVAVTRHWLPAWKSMACRSLDSLSVRTESCARGSHTLMTFLPHVSAATASPPRPLAAAEEIAAAIGQRPHVVVVLSEAQRKLRRRHVPDLDGLVLPFGVTTGQSSQFRALEPVAMKPGSSVERHSTSSSCAAACRADSKSAGANH